MRAIHIPRDSQNFAWVYFEYEIQSEIVFQYYEEEKYK